MFFVLCVLCCVSGCIGDIVFTQNEEMKFSIAGIFEKDATTRLRAFNESMRYRKLGPFQLDPKLLQPHMSDSYSVWKKLCTTPSIYPLVIFGPQNPVSDGGIRDQCYASNIPHIQATWQPYDPETEDAKNTTEEQSVEQNNEPKFKKITINFLPNADETAKAYAEMLKYYLWDNFAVLYEDSYGLQRVQKILSEFAISKVNPHSFPIVVRKLDPAGDNHKIFKELDKFQESRILLDCHANRIMKYMDEAKQLKMLNHYQHYVLTNMDASMVAEELSEFQSNFTWLSLSEYDQLVDKKHYLSARVGRWTAEERLTSAPVTSFETEALIMDDIANHVLKALKSINASHGQSSAGPCDKSKFSEGAQLQQELLRTQSNGITGNIEFNDEGKRVNYTYLMNEISVSKRRTVGKWDSNQPNTIIENKLEKDNTSTSTQASKHFIIISRMAKPFFFPKNLSDTSENREYEGYSVDIVEEIFSTLRRLNYNYTYSFSKTEHKIIGTYDSKTKRYNGVIGEILDKKADLGVCDITITEERKKVLDFSQPIMHLGISILSKKEVKIPPGTFSFLNPYAFEVWIWTATAYCLVSIVLFICSRISPADWENPQPCDSDPEELENIWNFKNCAWLTMGSIMTQGCDILPKAVGSRWVCGMWWFFAMIVCQTYIAQLAASLTSSMENEPIESVEDLAKQSKVLYGALNGGSTLDFFKHSKDKMYRRMYENMFNNPVVLVNDVDEGEQRVKNGKNKYVFFMESVTIDYKLKRDCDLRKIGNELDSKDYGIAMPANSPFRSIINSAILESKNIDKIKETWWTEKYDAVDCPTENEEGDVKGDLEMENLIGAFYVLIVGLVLCIFVAAGEFMNEIRNIVVRERVSHKEAFIKEFKASMNLFQLQKPVLHNPSRAVSVAPPIEPEVIKEKRADFLADFMAQI